MAVSVSRDDAESGVDLAQKVSGSSGFGGRFRRFRWSSWLAVGVKQLVSGWAVDWWSVRPKMGGDGCRRERDNRGKEEEHRRWSWLWLPTSSSRPATGRRWFGASSSRGGDGVERLVLVAEGVAAGERERAASVGRGPELSGDASRLAEDGWQSRCFDRLSTTTATVAGLDGGAAKARVERHEAAQRRRRRKPKKKKKKRRSRTKKTKERETGLDRMEAAA